MKQHINFLKDIGPLIIMWIALGIWCYISAEGIPKFVFFLGTMISGFKVFADYKGYKRLSKGLQVVAGICLVSVALFSFL